MNLNRPNMTEDVKSKDYTNKFLQTGSNPVTMEASGIVVPCEFSVRNLKRFLTENSDKEGRTAGVVRKAEAGRAECPGEVPQLRAAVPTSRWSAHCAGTADQVVSTVAVSAAGV